MKIGIIIIFNNNENDIDTSFFIEKLNETPNIELCLVNNASKDNTYALLKQIADECTNVSIINVKRFKSQVSAVRSGARFMSNQFDLAHLGYVCTSLLDFKKFGLSRLIAIICENQSQILSCNIKAIEQTKLKQTLFKSLFSIIDYLKKMKIKNQFIDFQKLSRL